MTPVTRLEQWIAPRVLPLLCIVSVLVVGGGIALYVIREHDLGRIEKLERVISCQDTRACRRFIYRAIRDLMRQREAEAHKAGPQRSGATLNLAPLNEPGLAGLIAPSGPLVAPPAPSGSKTRARAPEGTKRAPRPHKVAPQPEPAPPTDTAPGNSPDNGHGVKACVNLVANPCVEVGTP